MSELNNRFTYQNQQPNNLTNNNINKQSNLENVLKSDVFQYQNNNVGINNQPKQYVSNISYQQNPQIKYLPQQNRLPSIPIQNIVQNNYVNNTTQQQQQPPPIYYQNQRNTNNIQYAPPTQILQNVQIRSNSNVVNQPSPLFIQKQNQQNQNIQIVQKRTEVVTRQQYLPPEVKVSKIVREQPNVDLYRQSNWGSYYSPYGAQSRIPTTPPPAAVPAKTKTCCSPLILALLGLLALAGLIAAIVLALNYDSNNHASTSKVSQTAGIQTDQQYTVIEEITMMNTDPASAQTVNIDQQENDVTANGTLSAGNIISEEDKGTGNDVLKQSAGVDPLFTPLQPPKAQITAENNQQIPTNDQNMTSPADVPIIVLNATAIPQKNIKNVSSNNSNYSQLQAIPISNTKKTSSTSASSGDASSVTSDIPILSGVFSQNKSSLVNTSSDVPYVIVQHKKRLHQLKQK